MDEKKIKIILIKEEYENISKILYKLESKISENSKFLLYSRTNATKILNNIIIKLREEYIKVVKNLDDNENDLLCYSLYSKVNDNVDSENSSSISLNLSEDSNDSDSNYSDDSFSDNSTNSSNVSLKINKNKKKRKNDELSNESLTLEENIDINKYKEKFKMNKKIKEENKKIIEEINKEKINISNGLKIVNKDHIKYVNFNSLKNIRDDIIFLCKIIGFDSIKNIIFLEEGINNYNMDDDCFKILNEIFIPLDYLKEKKKNSKTKSKLKNGSKITIKKIKSKNVTLVDNCCEVSFEFNGNILKMSGFIKSDSLNILVRTCEISNLYLLEKKINIKNNLIKIINKLSDKDKRTAIIFYNNMTTEDLILINEKEIEDIILKMIKIYNEVTIYSFPKLIKFFTKDVEDNLDNIFFTIKSLLLGDDNNLAVANLLFNLLKYKKTEGVNISEIIYEKLNYISQIKLKRSKLTIQDKLDKLKEISVRDVDLKKQISVSKNIPQYIKKICLEKLEESKSSNNETGKIKMYVDYLIKFPWPTESDDSIFKEISQNNKKSKEFLENVRDKLEKNVYGHKRGKNKIIQVMGKLISSQGTNISPMALYGPPGVGKTKFAQSLAECLDMPFIQITLGGQNDGELLHGHGYTYSSAQPGLIIKKLTNVDSSRCIMYFDELDKCVSKNGKVNEVMSILTHLIDPMTNGAFQDRFFQEITFPLNKIFFIFSFNDESKIDSALLNRMEKIHVDSYTVLDKVKIAKNYLLKELFKEIGIEEDKYQFNDEMLIFVIENYTREPGVRSLKRSLENILLSLNVKRIYEGKLFDKNKTKITKEIIKDALGDEYRTIKEIPDDDMVGCVNGLYCNDFGEGGIIPIQIDSNYLGNSNKFSLELTGNQKKIMKESVTSSYNVAVSMLSEDDKKLFFKKYPNGLHIHTLDASTPKEGPSAGCAFSLAFLSVMLNLKIKKDVGMTGEVDLNGKIKAIGGLKYKIQGGFKAGVNTIFVPMENERDIKKIIEEYKEIFEGVSIYNNNYKEIDIETFKNNSKIKIKTNKSKTDIFNNKNKKIIFYDKVNDLLKYSLIGYNEKIIS